MSLQHSRVIWTTHSKVYFSIVSTNNINYSLRHLRRLISRSSNIFKPSIIPPKGSSKTKYWINISIVLQGLEETIESAFLDDHEILQFWKPQNLDKSIITKIFRTFTTRDEEILWEQFIILSDTVYFIVTENSWWGLFRDGRDSNYLKEGKNCVIQFFRLINYGPQQKIC